VTPDPELLGDDPVRLGGLGTREVLDAEPAPAWLPPRWLVVAALLLLVVATVGWFVDRNDRAHEARALDGCRHRLRDAAALSDLRLDSMADYLDPALAVTKGEQRGHIADEMAQPARRTLRDVERADAACRAVAIRPWHVAVASRQRATTAYSSALVTRLRDVAARGRSYFLGDGGLRRLRETAAIPVGGGPF
jgi:hypothetical protein